MDAPIPFPEASVPPGLDMPSLVEAMRSCPQTPTQSVLDHGRSVVDCFRQLRDHLALGAPVPEWWRVPGWARAPGLLDALPDAAILAQYQEFHDCGKPFCRVVDEQGRQRFPGHAETSARVWLAVGGSPAAARLMAMDMDAHLLRPEGVAGFAARPEAVALLLTAVAEVHSNAAMFGGGDSDSFKIKAKHLDKRGGQVMALIAAGAGGRA